MKPFAVTIVAILFFGTCSATYGQSDVTSASEDSPADSKTAGTATRKRLSNFGIQYSAAQTEAARKSGQTVRLSVRHFVINQSGLSPADRKALVQKFADEDDSAVGSSGTMSTDEIHDLLRKFTVSGHAKLISERRVRLEFGREGRIFEGEIVDLEATEKDQRLVVLAKSREGQLTNADNELLKKPTNGFAGLSTTATASLSEDHGVLLNMTTTLSQLDNPPRKGEKVSLSTQRASSNGIHFGERESCVHYWRGDSRQVATSARIPLISSIPIVGPRFFTVNKTTTSEHRNLIVITPELMDSKR